MATNRTNLLSTRSMEHYERELTPEEKWQEEENERLEYEGYCRKIKQGLENQDVNSGIRAIWELVQNARDQSKEARIKMELTPQSFIFSHHGNPFDYTSFRALVKQDSSKDRTDANLVGQYGTGFMTTHTFNRLVYVSAPYAVKTSMTAISGYVQIKDFPLDRTKVDTPEGPKLMKAQLDKVWDFRKDPLSATISDDTTSFRYDLQTEQVAEVSGYLDCAIRLMPFVLILNTTIQEIEIDNQFTGKRFTFKRSGEESLEQMDKVGWIAVNETVVITDNKNGEVEICNCKSLKSVEGDVVIIPPYPKVCGEVENIPSLFLWFPLLGTEKFGVNFIFHSKRFYPVEKRNNIMLPGVSQISKEKGGENERILKEMMQAVFDYYAKAEHAAMLSLDMCRVAFPEVCDNEETERFYKEMQELWKKEVPSWKVLPVGEEKLSVDDIRVRLLHSSFYGKLNVEKRKEYEPVMAQYAKLVKLAEEKPVSMPDDDLIAWSELVDRWHCDRNEEFFVDVVEVCSSIKNNSVNLHTFLLFLKDSGNGKLMEECPLLTNRKGDLCLRYSLYYGDFMTNDVYQLVSVMMGDAAEKMFNPAFLDVTAVNPYNIEDLRKDIANTLNAWRKNTIDHQPFGLLVDDKLGALIRFCSASYMEDFTNQRGRMMRLLVKFYQKDFEMIPTIKYLESNEEDFYKPAFNFLLDYTLSLLCQKSAEWVGEDTNKEWLLEFLKEYNPKENEDRRKKLDTHGVLPNQCNALCLKSDLKACKDVPDEMVEIYQAVFGKYLREDWIAPEFDSVIELKPVYAKEIANEIETAIVADMKQEGEHKFEKIIRRIILKIGESSQWKEWFGQIDDKKATYTFSMQSGGAQKSLFSLMDHLNDDHLERLAKLGENGDINELIDKLETIQQQERDSAARFNHLHTIGKHIENVLRERIGREKVQLEMPATKEQSLTVGDIQDGQDIIVRVNTTAGWKDIFYVEVKSKWDFNDPAHMSQSQIRMASQHSEEYALCCVDLRQYKSQDMSQLSEEVILGSTRVKLDIGKQLSPMMTGILNADKQPDEVQIKISEYRSNMSAKVFEIGEPFDRLLEEIVKRAKRELSRNEQFS